MSKSVCSKDPCDDRIIIVQGEDRRFTVVVLNENGEVKDLTGVTFIQSVHPNADPTFLIKSTTDALNPIEIISGTNKIRISLSQTETQALKAIKDTTIWLSIDFPDPLKRRVFKILDAYDVCESEFSLSAAP